LILGVFDDFRVFVAQLGQKQASDAKDGKDANRVSTCVVALLDPMPIYVAERLRKTHS